MFKIFFYNLAGEVSVHGADVKKVYWWLKTHKSFKTLSATLMEYDWNLTTVLGVNTIILKVRF